MYFFFLFREITGYLLFFRVFKLKSIRKLFPNLTVVRGDRLIRHYALILHDMPDLREVLKRNLNRIVCKNRKSYDNVFFLFFSLKIDWIDFIDKDYTWSCYD